MRLREKPLGDRIADLLINYENTVGPLPGIQSLERRFSLIEQLVESDRRNRYVRHIVNADLSPSRSDPLSGKFDPLKAAVLLRRSGETDEAFWMLFLFVHFGKHRATGWRYAASVYGKLGAGDRWDWASVCHDVLGFREWMEDNAEALKGPNGPHGFGNHRKYESLSGRSNTGTGAVVASYVEWIGPTLTHASRFGTATDPAGSDATVAFHTLYRSMGSIQRFGRTARFDYLSMAGKLGLAGIRPGRAYLIGLTGPLSGARLLFAAAPGDESAAALDERLIELGHYLNLGFDTLEDALCNWQKSPSVFKPFRG